MIFADNVESWRRGHKSRWRWSRHYVRLEFWSFKSVRTARQWPFNSNTTTIFLDLNSRCHDLDVIGKWYFKSFVKDFGWQAWLYPVGAEYSRVLLTDVQGNSWMQEKFSQSIPVGSVLVNVYQCCHRLANLQGSVKCFNKLIWILQSFKWFLKYLDRYVIQKKRCSVFIWSFWNIPTFF